MPPRVSVVVPVYNNQQTLSETCRRIMEVHATAFSDTRLELLFVNDGSKDGSWDELLRLQALHGDTIVLLNLSRNFGQLGALFAGFNRATGDAVICISADMQDPVELMAKMVALWRAGTEIVVCHREARRDGRLTGLFSSLAYAIARRSSPDLPKGGFDYWLMTRRVCQMLCSFKGRHNFIQGYLLSLGFTRALIPYTRVQRPSGKSGYTFSKKIKIITDFIVDSSYLPIRFMSCLGVAFAAAGVIYSLFIVYARFMLLTPFPGWAPIMIMLMVVGGIIMTMLGVIGEYIWRIYDNQRDFPLFVVSETRAALETKTSEHE